MEIHRSAYKHSFDDDAIGPDRAGNLLEVIWLELDGGREIVIHAMRLRPTFHDLLPRGEDF